MATEIETRLLEAAERLEEKLKKRAEEVRENEAALLGQLEKWTEQFHQWGEDLKGWDKRWSRAAVRNAAQRVGEAFGRAGEVIRGFVEKDREVIRGWENRRIER